MSCCMCYLRWLSEQGCLPSKGRLLDIGESCLLGASPQDVQYILDHHGGKVNATLAAALPQWFAARSITLGDPHIPTLFLSELLELTDVEYVAFDVVQARKAERFDLNVHALSPKQRNSFDLVLNFGTTEHLMNQYNAFTVIHDAVKPGGYMFHQLPTTGYINHGYFAYNPLMFRELATANGYETVAVWYWGQSGAGTVSVNPQAWPGDHHRRPECAHADGSWDVTVPDSLLNCLLHKVHDAPFQVGLEVATAAGALNPETSFPSVYINRAENGRAPVSVPLWRRLARYVKHLPGLRQLTGGPAVSCD